MANRYAPDNLWTPVREEAQDFDWSDHPNFDSEGDESKIQWHFWEPIEGPDEQRLVYSSQDDAAMRFRKDGTPTSNQPYEDEYDNSTSHGYCAEGPMMNFYWPLTHWLNTDPYEVAERLRHLNVCLVKIEDGGSDALWALALTGGGMDLSWSVAAGYIAAGFLPPQGLTIHQGGPKSTWEYGVSTIGLTWARRVRTALVYRAKLVRRRALAELTELAHWK
jgi:hypothetical protein